LGYVLGRPPRRFYPGSELRRIETALDGISRSQQSFLVGKLYAKNQKNRLQHARRLLPPLSRKNGQTTTYVLAQAAKHYISYVAPTRDTVRPAVMTRVRKSINKNRKLPALLAK
jgi:hypothetical protein